MKLPGKNTLRKAFLAVAATATLGGCAVVPMDPYTPPPSALDVYIQPVHPIPYITPYGPSYYNPTPYYHNHRNDNHHHRPAPRRYHR
jgi:hypothetical protein